jgi:signal transduction histidine kinase
MASVSSTVSCLTTKQTPNSAEPGSAGAPVRIEELAAVGRLASRLSGEARQPLSVLRTVAYFLNQHLNDDLDAKVRHHLTLLLHSVDHLDEMISNLAALAGAEFPQREPADVQALVDAAIGRAHIRTGIAIETAVEPEAVILCDPSQIRLALTNVINNSIQVIGGEGRIRIAGRHVESETQIVVSDNGPGMPEEVLTRVFEPFFTTAAHRVGLGLTAVQRLVGASGGTVKVESNPVDGTRVTMTFPRHAVPYGQRRP